MNNNEFEHAHRFSISITDQEWAKFASLCREHGYTKTAVLTKVFYKATDLLKNNQPIFTKLEDLEL